jgi:hypothetical protein
LTLNNKECNNEKVVSQKGFSAIVLVLLVLVLVLGAGVVYLLTQQKTPNQQNSSVTPTNIPNSTNNPLSTTSPNGPKVTSEFDLGSYKGAEYKLQWEAYPKSVIDKAGPNSDAYFNENINAPVRLVKFNSGSKNATLVKDLGFRSSAGTEEGYFSVLAHPQNSNKVYISQGLEGSDGSLKRLINLDSGQSKLSTQFLEPSCSGFSFFDKNQSTLLFFCDDQKNPVKLGSFDLLTEETKQILTLDPGQSFFCAPTFDSLDYKYEDAHTFSVKYCDKEMKILGTKTIKF